MTWKTGDNVSLPIYLESNAGAAQTYANQAAFLAASWTLTWYQAGVALGTQPTYTVTPLGSTGIHWFNFNLPAGVDSIIVGNPTGFRSDPAAIVLTTPTSDTDAIVSVLNTASGTPINNGIQTSYSFSVAEGDSFIKTLTVPAAALTDFGITDLTGTWTTTAAGRDPTDSTTGSPAFVMTVAILSGAARTITMGWGSTFPAGAAMSAGDILNGSKAWLYDVQLKTTVSNTITACVAGASGTFTMAGDVRKLFDVASAFTVTGSASNNGSYTVASVALVAGSTVVTITGSVPSGTAGGSVNVVLVITPIAGTITVVRQEDRT